MHEVAVQFLENSLFGQKHSLFHRVGNSACKPLNLLNEWPKNSFYKARIPQNSLLISLLEADFRSISLIAALEIIGGFAGGEAPRRTSPIRRCRRGIVRGTHLAR